MVKVEKVPVHLIQMSRSHDIGSFGIPPFGMFGGGFFLMCEAFGRKVLRFIPLPLFFGFFAPSGDQLTHTGSTL